MIDSHTAGEPTRVVVGGVSEPGGHTLAEKRVSFRRDFGWLRTTCILEPRGHEAIVGALLCEPGEGGCETGVIFFNNAGVLNGCLHGTMGVAVTLAHLGRIEAGRHRFDTPTGVVTIDLDSSGTVTVTNVRSYRFRKRIEIATESGRRITGDVAWGGNWFFLAQAPLELPIGTRGIDALTRFAWDIRRTLDRDGVTGEDGAVIDHIELFAPPGNPETADSRNFVLCPGRAFDRSPCGTGTSAKLACLYEDGELAAGETWRQAGILDTVFSGTVQPASEGGVFPTITGSAHVTAEADLLVDPSAPFAFGIPSLLDEEIR